MYVNFYIKRDRRHKASVSDYCQEIANCKDRTSYDTIILPQEVGCVKLSFHLLGYCKQETVREVFYNTYPQKKRFQYFLG